MLLDREMRFALIALLVACGADGGSPPPDASPVPTPNPLTDAGSCVAPGPVCSTTNTPVCGNGVAETCYKEVAPGYCGWFAQGETCDGTDVAPCTAYGYYGGTPTCTTTCAVVKTGCTACNSNAISCASAAFNFDGDLAVSGTRVAVSGSTGVAIFDGLTPVTQVAIPNTRALVGLPQGWLVATSSPPSVSTLSVAGVRGTPQALPASATTPVMAYGAGDRVVVAWNAIVPANGLLYAHAMIVDTSGNTIVPAFPMFIVVAGQPCGAVSDGTSFFVGCDGRLARIALDGTYTVATGMPRLANPTTKLTWAGTRGWYVTHALAYGDARQFDANGTPGASFDANGPEADYVAEGDELRYVDIESKEVRMRRVTVLGGQPLDFQFGASPESQHHARIAHYGSELVVAWNTGGVVRLALVN